MSERCHICVRNTGRYYDEAKHVWLCGPCIASLVETAERADKSAAYDRFISKLRRPQA